MILAVEPCCLSLIKKRSNFHAITMQSWQELEGFGPSLLVIVLVRDPVSGSHCGFSKLNEV